MKQPTIVDVSSDHTLASFRNEIHSKGNVFVAEDVTRRQLLVVAQKMQNIQLAIEEVCGESNSLASLFEASSFKLRKGKTGSFRVVKLDKEKVSQYLEERKPHFERVCIATTDPARWSLQLVKA